MGRLDGKITIVTGAASGIGFAVAKRFVEEGAIVYLADRDRDQGARAVERLAAGDAAVFVPHDVTQEDDWTSLMDVVLKSHARLDVLVNNAGIQITRGLEETSLADWRSVFAVNVEGPFLGVRAAVSLMKETGGGSIVNVCSTFGMVADGLNSAYCSSKAASRHLTKAAALYCADRAYNIRVNAVHPGVIMTPMLEREITAVTKERGLTDESSVRAEWERFSPLGIGEPADIAAGVLYFASDDSRYATGADLVIDGANLIR